MATDTSKIGIAAAQMMEKITDEYPEGTQVLDAIIIVAVQRADNNKPVNADPDAGDLNGIEIIDYWSSCARPIVNRGMLEVSLQYSKDSIYLTGIEEDDEDDDE